MRPFEEERFGNPSSIHAYGREARAAVDGARELLAKILGAAPHEIIFTSGGTESDNLAILGAARAQAGKGRHLVTCATEHHAVLHAFEYLKEREGFEVTILGVDPLGRISVDAVLEALRRDTVLVSVMSANNETGTLQPVRELGAALRERGVLFHTDAVQSFGKQRVDVRQWNVDLLSLSAHKFCGPKGAGLLYARAGLPIVPVMLGGFHENQRRAGTENVAVIVGMGKAAELAEGEGEDQRLFQLTEKLWNGLKGRIERIHRNGHPVERIGNTLNVGFEGCDSESLLIGFDLEGLAVSSGSACMVGSIQPSHVLLAMGVPEELARAAVRFSLGRETTEEDVATVIDKAPAIVSRVRAHRKKRGSA
jgi:cysteine desulfurase